jgi:hypothetical protein
LVRRIDRRGLDTDENVVLTRRWDFNLGEEEVECGICVDA